MKGKSTLVLWVLSGAALLLIAIYGVQVIAANLQARSLGTNGYCWLVPEKRPMQLPELEKGPTGFYLPSPFVQANRAVFGFGLDEPQLKAPHFGLAYKDDKGDIRLAGWSYLKLSFWTEPQDVLQKFVTKLDLTTCFD